MQKELNNDNPVVQIPPPLIFLGFVLFGILLQYLDYKKKVRRWL